MANNTIETFVGNFIKNNILIASEEASAKTSGGFNVVDGAVTLIDNTLNRLFGKFFDALGLPTLTSLSLNYTENTAVNADQEVVATLLDPTSVPLTITAPTPPYAVANSANGISIADTQPGAITVTPIGPEPPLAFKGVYPYVQTFMSESGHIRETDDTPGHERLFDYHKSGTYQEIDANGRRVVKVVGSNFTIVVQDDSVHVEGSQNVYVKGNINITCLNDVTIHSGGRLEINAKDDIVMRGKSIAMETTTGDFSVYSAANLNMTSITNTNIYSTKNANITSEANVEMIAGKSIVQSALENISSLSLIGNNRDAPLISDNKGLSKAAEEAIKAKKTGLTDPPSRSGSVPGVIEQLLQGADDDADVAKQKIADAVKSGRITQSQADELLKGPDATGESDLSKAGNAVGTGTTQGLEKLPDSAISDAQQLSKNYRISSLTNNRPKAGAYQLRAQGGRSKARIAANLCLLAQNTLEPIKKKYPNMDINSAFRHGSGKSQHDRGQAADLVYGDKSLDTDQMYEIAQWIKEHVPFDQLILEYGRGQIWTHVSYDGEKSAADQRRQVLTCANPANPHYESGLHKYSWSPK